MTNKISTLHSKGKNFFNEQLTRYDISYRQSCIMLNIFDHPGITQNKLCEAVRIDKGTIAKTLTKMETDEYVTKELNPNDSRSFFIYPTQKLNDLIPILKETEKNWEDTITDGLSGIEKQIFRELLNKAEKNALEYFKG